MTKVHAIKVEQKKKSFFLFTLKASKLFDISVINQRIEGKEEGYQRVLSPGRVKSVSRYIQSGGTIPGVIIISFPNLSYDRKTKTITLPSSSDEAGWVIDGQHRLAGAHEAAKAGTDIDLAIAAFEGVSFEEQVELFITINKEAKNVSSSLYLDLLKKLPKRKTEKEAIEERITDIARSLNSDEQSAFFQRIIFTKTARAGEISLTNFARVLRPCFNKAGGALSPYTQTEQVKIIDNYYKALQTSFPENWKNDNPIFLRTIGFGAVWRVFPFVFTTAISTYKAANISAFVNIFSEISGFDFEKWGEYGSGSGAESAAGEDLLSMIQDAFSDDAGISSGLRLD
ncbi:DGQHR domain-containing protein [Gluconobacter kondonii]|uniref:DGQHR domain-containing protein n=1 Tax=Gluconobacter kondonii TaxID=941463 RepID=UPI001981395C|nr:DGQHR domain-containing protein [Gluconobacter kondonii]MBN3866417.1 DGQHR domain-containing protein [Gluconobacter kondonii]